jgi:multiple sugar transport system permease protein
MLPMSTVILMAGMSSIPQDVKDAAEVDGVGFWRTYFQVTLPLIRPIMLVAFLFGVIFTFTDMTIIHVLTRGSSDNSTQVLASYAFYKGIDGGNLSQGAATAIFMLPVLLGLAMLLLRTARRTEVR